MSKENRPKVSDDFNWKMVQGVDVGRKNLGAEMPVTVYRLFEYTMYEVLANRYGIEDRDEIFREAGELAGRQFCKNLLNKEQGFNSFVAELQQTLKDLKIGVLRIESVDEQTGKIYLTISEDLDCSGLPVVGETVCHYDEGLIAGILSEYSGKDYTVREIDCWAKGDRVCRFEVVEG